MTISRSLSHLALTALLIVSSCPLVRAAAADNPPTEIAVSVELQAIADGLAAQIAAGDASAYERFAQEHFAANVLARRTPEQRNQMLATVHGDLGEAKIASLVATGPWSGTLTLVTPAGQEGILSLELEPTPPHRLAVLGVELKAGGGEKGPQSQFEPLPNLSEAANGAKLAAALDPYLERFSQSGRFSGVVLVAHFGQTLFERGFGMANRELGIANGPGVRFNIASIGKQFTHVALGQLLAQGKLALSDPLSKYLPNYANAQARTATLQQLLDHQGGIADIFSVEPQTPPRNNRDWYNLVAPLPLDFAPGTNTRYCNGCYVVLGEVVAAVSGLSYEEYVAKNIFAVAGMTGAAFLAGSDRQADQAVQYTSTPKGDLEPTSLGPDGRGSGAGGFFARAADLLAYENALRSYRLLDRERTHWLLGSAPDAAPGRAGGDVAIAGGSPGTNAVLESEGVWTVIVLTNRDPRTGEDFGLSLSRALPHR